MEQSSSSGSAGYEGEVFIKGQKNSHLPSQAFFLETSATTNDGAHFFHRTSMNDASSGF